MPFRQWFRLGHVERSANPPGIERLHQRIRIHNRPPSGIHQQRALPQQPELPLADKPTRFRGRRQNQYHHLRARQQGVQPAYRVHFGL